MIKIIDMLVGLFGGKNNNIKKQAADMMEQHGDTLDQITDKIPGQKDDEIVDQAREILKK